MEIPMQLRMVCALIGADPEQMGPMLQKLPLEVHYLFNSQQRIERKLDLLLDAENERRRISGGGDAICFERTPTIGNG